MMEFVLHITTDVLFCVNNMIDVITHFLNVHDTILFHIYYRLAPEPTNAEKSGSLQTTLMR